MKTLRSYDLLFAVQIFLLSAIISSCGGCSSINISFENVSTLEEAGLRYQEYYKTIETQNLESDERSNYRKSLDSLYCLNALKIVKETCESIRFSQKSYDMKSNDLNKFMEEFSKYFLDVDNRGTLQICNAIIQKDFSTYKFESAWSQRMKYLRSEINKFIDSKAKNRFPLNNKQYHKEIQIYDSIVNSNSYDVRKVDYLVNISCKFRGTINSFLDTDKPDYLLSGDCRWSVVCDKANEILPLVTLSDENCYTVSSID